jgi:mono/diheme cytochrome c family protein
MVIRILVAGLVFMVAAVGASAQTKIEKAPIARTSPGDAPGMFQTYCAVCHGKDGKGGGPAASALTKAPADLTRIAARNGGTFPEVRVKRYIEGADEVAAHGTRDMPMWGDLFKSLSRDTALIRVQGLSDYLKSLQVK